ncbi:Nonribosomal peptide synthetases (NRPS) [Penicillium soppii]|uniref:Nonribosomal peptide synthetases (NRPS) n=1 Tax=Penicillium soppii TaxID=69789 RepID=UPI002547FB64|nr:Nonribosomal peptide synthetases (NRPS) [Penicillium soppii]KAJ5874498.1 Nonribosomal peptide synthetases (NRPS) [Penicillium soppii]
MSHGFYPPRAIPLDTKPLFGDTIVTIEDFEPTEPSHALPHLSPEDAGAIREWNKTIPSKVSLCVHDLIQSRGLSQPEAVAVCASDGQLTYRELDIMSSALATQLVNYDMGPNRIVPLIFEKSMWTTIALLGVMKAGGAFLLVDIAHPVARLREILDITTAKLVIASETQAVLARQLDLKVVYLGVNVNAPNKTESCTQLAPVPPHRPAYCVFTSGSTGKPKGFCVQHDAFATMAAVVPEAFGLSSTSRVFQFASHAFDASVFEYLACLVMGGCLCIPSESARSSSLAEAINVFQADWTILTPSVSRIISPAQVPTLRTLVMTGEPMREDDVERWSGNLRLVNGYGPSECAVCCSVCPSVTSATEPGQIGRALGAVLWLVDPEDHEKLVEIGAVGEILVEGHTVGKGYLSNQEHTSKSLIDPPYWLTTFRQAPCSQVYKTGDLAVYLPNGTLQLRGRKDTQVKIRGQRVELVEVEQRLRNLYPRDMQVVAEIAKTAQEPVLVAFVCHSKSSEPGNSILSPPSVSFHATAQEAANTLRQTAPDYMVPSTFFPVNFIPTTITGKTDRRQLRLAVERLSRLELAEYNAPAAAQDNRQLVSDPTQIALRKLWCQALHLDGDGNDIGPKHNFFHLGGTSIDAMKLASLCQKNGFKIRVSTILTNPELDKMSSMIYNHHDEGEWLVNPINSVQGVKEELIQAKLVSSADTVDIFPSTEFQRWNLQQPCDHLSIRLPAALDISRLEAAWKKVLKRHAALRTGFLSWKKHTFQVVQHHFELSLERIDVDEDLSCAIEKLIREPSRQFPCPGTPPFHLTLMSSLQHRVLLVRISHAQYDGISLRILYRDLMTAYAGKDLVQGTDFPDYMRVRCAQGTSKSFDYWRKVLDGATMPTLWQPRPGPPGCLSLHMQDIQLPLPPTGITRATLLMSAWAWVLAVITGRSDVVFGYVSSGRDVPLDGANDFIGSAVTTVPLRLIIQRSWSIADFLWAIQMQRISNAQYEVVDFEDIVLQSTSWSAGTQLDSVFSYEDFGASSEILLEGIHCPSQFHFQKAPTVPYALINPQEDAISVRVAGRTDFLSQDEAVRLCEMLCTIAIQFAKTPDRALPWESLVEAPPPAKGQTS